MITLSIGRKRRAGRGKIGRGGEREGGGGEVEWRERDGEGGGGRKERG